MSRLTSRALVALGSLMLLLLALAARPRTAAAHEGIEVGNYEFTIGWMNEPALVGLPNGPYIAIALIEKHEHTEATPEPGHTDEHQTTPVEGAEAALTFEVEFGSARQTYALRPVFGQPGIYTTDFVPTRPGQYTFRFGGSINGEAIDFVFDPEEIGAADSVMFPEPAASNLELTKQVQAAQAQASTAQLIAIVASVLGLAGLGVGVFGLLRKK